VGIKSSLKPEHLLAALFRLATADKRIKSDWSKTKAFFTGISRMSRIKAANQISFFDLNYVKQIAYWF
jgi:hypothetical protein